MPQFFVEKLLTPNDIGDTNSHQAGIHIPKSLSDFFPALAESHLNPRATISFQSSGDAIGVGVYIHYNNKVVADGTRDEYRITRVRSLLRDLGAIVGDTLELVRLDTTTYAISVRKARQAPAGALIVNLAHGWRTIRI